MPEILSAEQNYVFNTKKPIPAGKVVGFKDGNADNIAMKNLILVDAPVGKSELTEEELAAKEAEKAAKKAEKEAKKEAEKAAKNKK